jgi:hypothetical protein
MSFFHRRIGSWCLTGAFLALAACSGGPAGSPVATAPSAAPAANPRRIVATKLTKRYKMPKAIPSTFTFYCPQNWKTGKPPALCAYYDPGTSTAVYLVGAGNNCGLSNVESLQLPKARIGVFLVNGYSPGACTVSLMDSNRHTASATITFSGKTILGPLSVACPGTSSGPASCTYADPSYTGGYAVVTSSGTCTATAPASGGFTVSDTVSETCTVTLIATSTGQQAQAAIAFTLTQTFSYTGAVQTVTVPAGVTQATITALGAEGAQLMTSSSSFIGTAGYGASVTGTFSVTPGQTLYVYVGGSGNFHKGFNGGGGPATTAGGGASDVRISTAALTGNPDSDPRIIVAAGGGSTGFSVLVSSGVEGATGGSGGNGGAAGGAGAPGNNTTDQEVGLGGGGGTQTAGGLGGAAGCIDDSRGSSGGVGNGGSQVVNGGNGGGGWFGGGAGGQGGDSSCTVEGDIAGGGGGSSFVESSATSVSSTAGGNASADGQVTITW